MKYFKESTVERGQVYKLERIDPLHFSLDQALDVAELFLQSFQHDPYLQYVGGRYAQFGIDLQVVRESIRDPRQRLQELIHRAVRYKIHCYTRARFFHKLVRNPNTAAYGLYTEDRLLAGFVSYDFNHVVNPQLTTWTQRLYYSWLKFKYFVQEVWSYGLDYYNNPLISPNRQNALDSYRKEFETSLGHKNTLEYLTKVSSDELESLAYPDDKGAYYTYLGYAFVSPFHQRKGLGQFMLEETITKDVPLLLGSDAHDILPAKIMLKATAAGYPLYKKCGFKDVFSYTHRFGSNNFSFHRMEMLV
uniref:ARAD1B02464p n=1 Tax=Blastobotrys adeninivorans TaxID=409370 RepID=A0A060T9U8_BLAAD